MIEADGAGRDAPTSKAGWRVFVSREHPSPPELLDADNLALLDPVEREIYDDRRRSFHSGLLLVYTPQIQQVVQVGMKRLRDNQGKEIGRKGLAVLGCGGTGKSTSITQLGRRFQRDLERSSAAVTDRIPVVYITTPPDPDPRKLAMELAGFLGLPFGGAKGRTRSPAPSPRPSNGPAPAWS